jgi:hypothetical protein
MYMHACMHAKNNKRLKIVLVFFVFLIFENVLFENNKKEAHIIYRHYFSYPNIF